MDLTDEEVQEYKHLHEKEFNETISDAEAREIASRLLLLYELLAQPLPSELSGKPGLPPVL